jgi:hypothetical protein
VTIHAIPTKYASTQFRSRLEARWAAFFDLVGWRWEYEPFDLAGWIPDFALIGARETPLVEVKPIAKFDDLIAEQACAKAEKAMRDSGRKDEILLLGFTWPVTDTRDLGIGWLAEWFEDGYPETAVRGWELPHWAAAPFHSLGGLGFRHGEASWRNRITGEYDGDNGAFAEAPLEQWREAGSTVQWQPGDRP